MENSITNSTRKMPAPEFKWRLGTSFNFSFNQNFGVHHKKDHIKVSQFTKFEVLPLDCNHVKGFQKSEKLDTLYRFERHHLRIRDICMEFG